MAYTSAHLSLLSNTLSGGNRTNAWDSQNRLTSCTKGGTTSAYTYGADGLRRSSTVNNVTTYYVYDGQTLIRELKKNLSTGAFFNSATCLVGPRGPEYRRDDTATELDSQNRQVSKCRWYVFDGLGSVVGEVDPSGNMTSSPKYDVYGLTRSNPGTASSRQGFVGSLGHISDSETGLIYMQARYYDPSLGRFNSEDIAKSGANWLVYCDNNPTNRVDRTGKDSSPLAIDAMWFVEMCVFAAFILHARDLYMTGNMILTDGTAKIEVGQGLIASGGIGLGKELVLTGMAEASFGRADMMGAVTMMCIAAVAMITFTYDAFAKADDSTTIEGRLQNL